MNSKIFLYIIGVIFLITVFIILFDYLNALLILSTIAGVLFFVRRIIIELNSKKDVR
jgi:VIT1/CCC1 family predicted Fe2+/Mn2+ transporter